MGDIDDFDEVVCREVLTVETTARFSFDSVAEAPLVLNVSASDFLVEGVVSVAAVVAIVSTVFDVGVAKFNPLSEVTAVSEVNSFAVRLFAVVEY